MPDHPPLTYHDPNSGDTYTVYLDTDGDFSAAARYTGRVGFDAIWYDELEEVPQPHREAIRGMVK